jgi:alpha-galactosidase
MSMKKIYFSTFCCIIFLFVFFSGCQKKSDLTEENKGSEDKIAIAAATPPMGWNSWNCFQADINEEKIRAVVDAMIATGMKDAGYEYINLDDGWMAEARDQNGNLQSHPDKFPSGIKALVDYAHRKGLKLGLYSSNGTNTCQRVYPGSLGNEEKDARLFVEWGVDYLKYDWCNHASINYSPDIDKISISGGQGKEIFYEAESPENTLGGSGNGAAVIKEITFKKDNKATVSGKKASNIGNNSGSLQFNNIDAPSDGEYQMKIYYSNPDFPFKRAYISVNSETAVEADMPFPGEIINGSPVIAMEEPPQAPPAGGVPGGMPPAGAALPAGAPAGGPPPGGFTGAIMSRQDVMGVYSMKVKLKAGKNTIKFYNPMTDKDNAIALYTRMSEALKKAYAESSSPDKRQIVMSICEWGANKPWEWGKDLGQLWRTTFDINDSFTSVLQIIDQNESLAQYAGSGHWNDPDMLEVGNGGMTDAEYRSHFSLWCMMAAPLLTGNDLSMMSEATKVILMNKDAIAVDQDSLGIQGKRIRKEADIEVWTKPLANGDAAVALFNRGDSEKQIATSLEEIGLNEDVEYVVKDLWTKKEQPMTDDIIFSVPSHGVALLRIFPAD